LGCFCRCRWCFPVGQKGEGSTHKPIRFGILGHVPYGYYTEAGKSTGYLYEIANKIFEQARYPKNVEILPHKRLNQEMAHSRVECTMFAKVPFTISRCQMLELIGKFVEDAILPRADVRLNRYEDLKNLTIAVPRGVNMSERFDRDASLRKVETKDYEQNARLLKFSRVDAALGVLDSMLLNVLKVGMKLTEIGTPLILSRHQVWVICVPGALSERQIEDIKQATRALREDGTIARIIGRYLNKLKSQKSPSVGG
jgi:ABC-type amino acid transport substrate-binding protein